jgi:Ulp1 family protease
MHYKNEEMMDCIERSYTDEAVTRKMEDIVDLKSKKLLKPFEKLSYSMMPKQTNTYDCGVFMVMTINFLIDKIPLSYLDQEDMKMYRIVLATDIINQKMNYYK